MSIVDDLIENLVERNAITLNGSLKVALVEGGVRITGALQSTLRDQRKNRQVLKADIPVDARVTVGDIVIPLPEIK